MLKQKQAQFYYDDDDDEQDTEERTPDDIMNSDFFNDDIYDYKERFFNRNNNHQEIPEGDLAQDEEYDLDENTDENVNFQFQNEEEDYDENNDNLINKETFFKRVDSMEFVKQKQPKVIDKYLIGELLGDGSYGKVKECLDMENLSRRAVKIINLKMVARKIPKGVQNVRKEIKIMKKLNHKNLIKLYSTFEKGSQPPNNHTDHPSQCINLEKPPKLYIFMDYCITSLEKLLKTAPLQRLTNFQANYYFKQLIEGLEYLHSLNIIHNDIKPGNLLITCDDTLKICDFSISADLGMFSEEEYIKDKKIEQEEDEENFDGINPNLLANSGTGKFPIQQCTPMFQCPEMLDENIDEILILKNAPKIDVWSTGVTLYQLTTGNLPFQGQTLHQIFELIRSEIPIEMPEFCDKNLKALLNGMLTRDIMKRWSIHEIRECEWFKKKHPLVKEEMAPLPQEAKMSEANDQPNLSSDKFYSAEEDINIKQNEVIQTHINQESTSRVLTQATKAKKTNCSMM
ncbi:unnamed protein product [Brachionus calyciflorus]|uniref:non-specific serine/threonine protein kinase n=1 Tax=Brachionus calyciflorus TaxID=104777 RepID=A0A813MRD3_9BILA|nr:unnamed protein product [Brachionus calyciflorus]